MVAKLRDNCVHVIENGDRPATPFERQANNVTKPSSARANSHAVREEGFRVSTCQTQNRDEMFTSVRPYTRIDARAPTTSRLAVYPMLEYGLDGMDYHVPESTSSGFKDRMTPAKVEHVGLRKKRGLEKKTQNPESDPFHTQTLAPIQCWDGDSNVPTSIHV